MSRIIVKNLPKKIREDKIRQIFGEKGKITDVQLKFTPDGKFRQFAFIGYNEEHEALEAIKHFNNMCIATSKLTVEACHTLGDVEKPRSWSKYAPDSTAHKQKDDVVLDTKQEPVIDSKKKKKRGNIEAETEQKSQTEHNNNKKKQKSKPDETTKLLQNYKDDPNFLEFLEVHDSQAAQKLKQIATNDNEMDETHSDVDSDDDKSEDEASEEKETPLCDKEIDDLEYMKQLMKNKAPEGTENTDKPKKKKEPKNIEIFLLKLSDLAYKIKKRDIKDFFKPLSLFTIRIPRHIHGIAYVGFKKEREMKKGLQKDRSIMNGHSVTVREYKKPESRDNSGINDNPKWRRQEEHIKSLEDIGESGIIFFRNLAYSTTEEDIREVFSKFGDLAEVDLPVDRSTNQIKGFGTVTFMMPEHAVRAYTELDGTIFHGRMFHLMPGKDKTKENKDEPVEGESSFKKQKNAEQKSKLSSFTHHNWNSLFLGQNAVADVVAATYNISKRNLLMSEGRNGGSGAVNLALAETKIVTETRKYLEQEGIILDAFSTPPSVRSKTILLIKNLPVQTQSQEIQEMCEKYGTISRVILPPSGITAVVEFLSASEAKRAYLNLAYSKYKDTKLYLEFAPENALTQSKNAVTDDDTDVKAKKKNKDANEDNTNIKSEKDVQEREEEEPEPDTILFVKNVNFKTTDDALRKHFESCGRVNYATVARKKHATNPEHQLSMGYAFVRFFANDSAKKAMRDLQHSTLDGKSIELQWSKNDASKQSDDTGRKTSKLTKPTGTKILIRNVPFQARRKEIQELFGAFGEIKSLRLPQKMSLDSNSHRGFAFVDFTSPSDAKNAFEALSQSTHLFGRRLVLEWANTDESVEAIRKRTVDHFGEAQATKKFKKGVFTVE